MKRLLLVTLIAAALVAALIAPMSVCAAATASRSVPISVAPGAEFEVTINVSGYGDFGLVEETLPAGFSYLGLSEENPAIVESVEPGSQEVGFYLLGAGLGSFTYQVEASTAKGPHTFTGKLFDDEPTEFSIDDSTIYVGAVASREMQSTVNIGNNFDVTIEVSGYGGIGLVEETLPTGFTYQSSEIEGVEVEQAGQVQTVRFALMGDEEFTYTVKAPSTSGTYTFIGMVKDIDKDETPVGGDEQITVRRAAGPVGPGPYVPPATATPTPTATPVVTPTVTPTATPVVTPTVTPTATPTATPVVTPTPTPPPVTPTPTPTPTPAEEEAGTNIGVIIGPIIAVILIAIIAYWWLRRRGEAGPPGRLEEPEK